MSKKSNHTNTIRGIRKSVSHIFLINLMVSIALVNAQQYNFKPFALENDLEINAKGSSENHLSSSKKGYLFISGHEALYQFDGKTADPLIQEFELPFSHILNIQEGENGKVYFINNGKLQYITKDQVQEVPLNETLTCYQISGDYIFFGTNQGLKRYNDKLNIIDVPDDLNKLKTIPINDLKLSNNNLIIATSSGVWQYNQEKAELKDFSKSNPYNILEITLDRENRIWSFDDQGNIITLDFQSQYFNRYNNQGFDFTTLTCDLENRMWFGSSNKGLLRFDQTQNKWSAIDQKRGLSDNRILDMETDEWGTVWVTTADHILSKFIDKDYELFNVYNGLPSDDIYAIFSNENDLLFSAGTKGVFQYINSRFETIANTEAIIDTKCTSIYVDSSGLWIGTSGKGLVKINENEYTVFRKESGLPSDWITELSADTSGNLWIGSPSNGLARLSRRDSFSLKIDAFGTEEGVGDLHITALYTKKNGLTYYGTVSGKAGLISGDSHFSIRFQDNDISEITDIVEDRLGNIYISTLNNGLFIYGNEEKGMAAPVILEEITLPNEIKAALIHEDMMWLINDKGVYNFALHQKSPIISKFLVSDGFPSNKIRKGNLTVFQNKVWSASADGLIKIGQINQNNKTKIPKVHFTEIMVDFLPLPQLPSPGNKFVFIKHKQNLSFNFHGVDINTSKDLLYSYILEGRDKLWSPWTKSDNQSYNNLAPGNYSFKVRAKSQSENISEPITYDFEVRGPIWKEWWFMIASILVLFGAIWLLFRSRLKAIKRRNSDQQAKLELKNKLLELEQKANQLQMNPHFIFNALNSIQSTVAKEDYKDARKEINDFAILMRSILSNSKERVITLQDEISLLEKYVHIEKTCRSLDFDFNLEIAEGIDSEEIMIPPMLIQPFLENAIVHGLSKKQSGELAMRISLLDEYVMECQVIDNGIGYENAKKIGSRKKHKSIAIQVTKERLENLLEKKYLPAVEIFQIDPIEGGTKVLIKIPVEYNF